MIDLNLSASHDAIVSLLAGQNQKLRKAMERAVRKTQKFLSRKLAAAIAKETLIPQKSFKFRVFTNLNTDDMIGHIWIGLNPLSASRAGKPKQMAFGARAGKHRFDGAFVAAINGGKQHIWKRSGKFRLPIEKQTIDIEEPGLEVVRRLERQAQDYFQKRLNEELRFALNREGA